MARIYFTHFTIYPQINSLLCAFRFLGRIALQLPLPGAFVRHVLVVVFVFVIKY